MKNRSYKEFIKEVINFNQVQFRNESISEIIIYALKNYLLIPDIKSASLFSLFTDSFDFHLSNTTDEQNKEQIVSYFDEILEEGGIAEVLDKASAINWKLVDTKKNTSKSFVIIPVISTEGIQGIILLRMTINKQYNPAILGYFNLLASQMAYILHSKKIEKELYVTKGELDQIVAAKTEILRQSERELKVIIDSILTSVLVIERLTGKIIDANYAALKLLNVSKEDLINTKRCALNKDGQYFNYEEILNKNIESIIVDKNGKEIQVLRTISKIVIGNQNIYLESFIDITERKKNETEIKKQIVLLNGVAEAANNLLSESNFNFAIKTSLQFLGKALNIDGVHIYKNFVDNSDYQKKTERKFRWSSDNNIIDESCDILSYEADLYDWYDILESRLPVSGVIDELNETIRSRFEATGTKSILVFPIIVNNEFWGFIGFDECKTKRIWSISEVSILKAVAASIGGAIQREESKLELIKSKEKAEQAESSDKLKSEFLAQMSHEIRTPVSTLLNFSFIIKEEFEDKLTEEQKNLFEVMSNAGNRIIRTVDLILNTADIESGNYNYKKEDLDLQKDIIMPLLKDYHPKAKKKNLELVTNNNMTEIIISADKFSIEQIFRQLIENAIIYTEKGCIEISLSKDSNGKIKAIIKDSGIGISENYIGNLFTPFSQEQNGYTRKYEGNGLGLALVKKYCDLNKILIDVQSAKGIGSSFVLTFQN